MQQLLSPGPLLNPQGELAQAGYATSLVKAYDRKAIRAAGFRIKEWDYYCIIDGDTVLALTIDDNSYMGLDSVTLIDLKESYEHTWSSIVPFPMGRRKLPSTSLAGDVEVVTEKYALSFGVKGDVRTLNARVENFDQGKPLKASVTLRNTPRDSMVIATPWREDKKAFYYNQKINNFTAEGKVEFNGKTYLFNPSTAQGVLDWGRGVWTYRNTWYWGSLSGRSGVHRVGLNLGYGFGDTSAASENMLFVDGIAHKLGTIDFGIPQDAKGEHQLMSPWHITEESGRLDLVFTPLLDRASCTSALVIESDQHQIFGEYSGKVVTDSGEVLLLEAQRGFAEKVKNKW